MDFAPLGHCSLHLNVRPTFGVVDALQNLHRLDASLLEGLMTQCKGGLQLLAGPQQPQSLTPTAAELARLFDLLVAHFRYVVVDCSGRVDQTARLLCDLSNAVLLVAQRRRGFTVERQPHSRVSGRRRHPRSGAHRSQSLQENSRLHRRGRRKSHQLQAAVEDSQQLPVDCARHRQGRLRWRWRTTTSAARSSHWQRRWRKLRRPAKARSIWTTRVTEPTPPRRPPAAS